MQNEQSIHVALASDDNYFEGLLVTAVSIAQHCSRPKALTIHLLDGGVSPSHYAFLQEKISLYGSELSSVRVDQKAMESFNIYHGSRMTYARFLLPDLLPDVGTVIYSDVDILWHADVAQLWQCLDPDAVLHYVPHHPDSFSSVGRETEQWFRKNGFALDKSRYFCAGMIVMNLEKFRAESLGRKMIEVAETRHPQNDEPVLNAFMATRDDVRPLDYKWQIGTGITAIIPDDLQFVLHYAADTPWKSFHANHHMLTDAILLWHKFHAQLRGITTWQSLRGCNSPIDIVAGRTLFLLAVHLKIVRLLIKAYMILCGKKDGLPVINAFMVRSKPLAKMI